MPGPEATVERKDRERRTAAGWFVDKIMKTARNGFPDRFYARAQPEDVCPCCGRGRVVLIEWKRPGGRPRGQQDKRIAELRAAGVEVYVLDNLEDADAVFDRPLSRKCVSRRSIRT